MNSIKITPFFWKSKILQFDRFFHFTKFPQNRVALCTSSAILKFYPFSSGGLWDKTWFSHIAWIMKSKFESPYPAHRHVSGSPDRDFGAFLPKYLYSWDSKKSHNLRTSSNHHEIQVGRNVHKSIQIFHVNTILKRWITCNSFIFPIQGINPPPVSWFFSPACRSWSFTQLMHFFRWWLMIKIGDQIDNNEEVTTTVVLSWWTLLSQESSGHATGIEISHVSLNSAWIFLQL